MTSRLFAGAGKISALLGNSYKLTHLFNLVTVERHFEAGGDPSLTFALTLFPPHSSKLTSPLHFHTFMVTVAPLLACLHPLFPSPADRYCLPCLQAVPCFRTTLTTTTCCQLDFWKKGVWIWRNLWEGGESRQNLICTSRSARLSPKLLAGDCPEAFCFSLLLLLLLLLLVVVVWVGAAMQFNDSHCPQLPFASNQRSCALSWPARNTQTGAGAGG